MLHTTQTTHRAHDAHAGRPIHFRRRALSLLAAAALTACGGGGGDPGDTPGGPLACVALPAEVTWQRDTLSSAWNDVLIDSRHRIWLAGYTNGRVGESNLGPSGDSRALLRQWAPDGRLLWDAGSRFDTPGTDIGEALATDAQGTVFMAGRTTGAFAGAVNQGQFDSFVAWSDTPGGSAPWRVFQTGSETPQHPRRLAVDAQGSLVLAGEDDDHVPSNHVAAWSDAFTLHLRRSGAGTAADSLAEQWQHQAGSAEPDIAGGLAVSGAASFVSGAVLSGAQRGMFLRKIGADGRAVWTARYSSNGLDHIAVVRALPDGSLLIGGSVYGSFQGAESFGAQDVFVARVRADDGQVLQRWQFGSATADWLADLQVDGTGKLIVFGETEGRLAPGGTPAGQNDLFLLKLSADGRVLAARQWGTADDERAARLAVDGCGGIVAVGSSGGATRRDALVWFWRP